MANSVIRDLLEFYRLPHENGAVSWAPSGSTVEMQGGIVGLDYGMQSGNPSGAIQIEVGYCWDSTGQVLLNLETVNTKEITTSWEDGDGGGGLANGTVQSASMYHVFIIGKDDGTTSTIIDDNLTCTNIPSGNGYIYHRWLGYIWTNNASIDIVEFWMNGTLLRFNGADIVDTAETITILADGFIDLQAGAPFSKIDAYFMGSRKTINNSGTNDQIDWAMDDETGDNYKPITNHSNVATTGYTLTGIVGQSPCPATITSPYATVSTGGTWSVNIPTVWLKR